MSAPPRTSKRKINFTAEVAYTTYPYGKPGEKGSVLARADDVPARATSFTSISAMSTADAVARLTAQCKGLAAGRFQRWPPRRPI